MKRWLLILVIAVPVALVGTYLLYRAFAATDDVASDAASAVKSAPVGRGDIQVTIDATGTIEPLNIVTVNSKANGQILELLVDEGDYVAEGEVIARIETTYVQVDVDQAEADRAAAQARFDQAQLNIELQREQVDSQIIQAQKSLDEATKKLEQLTEQIRIEKQANQRAVESARNDLQIAEMQLQLKTSDTVREEEIRRAEASVSQAKANLDLARKDHGRKKVLFEKGYLSQSEMDSEEAQLRSSEAQYESALEQLKMVKEPASETELKVAQANVQKARFALQAALEKVESEKYRDMELELQQNRVDQARESLRLAETNRAQITVKEKDLENARAQLRRSEVQLDLAKERLDDTIIRAPISGTILEKRVEEGQVITSTLSSVATSEGTTLVAMADLSRVYVVAEVDETDIGKVEVGQQVQVTIEAYPDQPFWGTVLKIAPRGKVVQNVTTFDVTTELTNVALSQGEAQRKSGRPGGGSPGAEDFGRRGWQASSEDTAPSEPGQVASAETPDSEGPRGDFFDTMFSEEGFAAIMAEEDSEEVGAETPTTPFLKPGMNATVEIWIASRQNVLLVPNEAVLAFGNRKMVRVIGEDGLPGPPQPVVTGVSSFDQTEILSGVEEGQRVVLGGFERSNRGIPAEFRRMMQNPASTMRRMQGGFGGRGRR